MTNPPARRVFALAPALSLFALPLLQGCGSSGSGRSGPATSGPVVLDGDVGEWRGDAVAAADERFLYLRFSLEGAPATLQNNAETTRIAVDTDNDPTTGFELVGPPEVGTLGVDLEVRISPHFKSLPEQTRDRWAQWASSNGEDVPAITAGVAATRYLADGTPRPATHAEIDFTMAPTYASEWVEARIGRLGSALIGSGLDAPGTARAMVLIEDDAREVVGFSDPFEVGLPRVADDLGLATRAVPVQQAGTVRVLSFNVLRAKPAREPEAFARLIAALAPDVILFQEFDGLDAAELGDWLDEHVGTLEAPGGGDRGAGSWAAVALPDHGVAVATPHPIARPFDEPVTLEGPSGRERTARAVSAVIDTPLGPILATSLHLKCCGSADSREDRIRMAEAEAINAAFARLLDESAGDGVPALRVIGGDVNLVGTRPPLDRIGVGLDVDGSDLSTVEARVLGDRAYYTWSDPDSAFSPGRLDWILYADAGAAVTNAFVLDLGRLTRRSVEAAGLDPTDTAASDHLPLVVDLRPLAGR